MKATLESISARYPRWVTGPETDIKRAAEERGRMLLFDAKGHPLLLFDDTWGQRWAIDHEPALTFHEAAP